MEFSFTTSGRIIFGLGSITSIGEILKYFGNRVFFIHGKSQPEPEIISNIIKKNKMEWEEFTVFNEPSVEVVDSAVKLARKVGCDCVIGFGGGAVIDTGKAVAAMVNNPGEVLDYLEIVGKGNPIQNPSKPYIAVPTTAGTGSEVTKNAVISVTQKKVKVSMRNTSMIPTIAVIDPELTYSVPPAITASTGMDAFTQVIEPYVSKLSNRMVDLFCVEGIKTAAKSLSQAYKEGQNAEARSNMSWVSLLGGLSLANAKLGAVHGFAGPIGGMFHASHGSICAALLPSVMKINIKALQEDNQRRDKLNRYKQIAEWVTGNKNASAEDGANWVAQLSDEMEIPSLRKIGIKIKDIPLIIEKSKNASSMKGNPIQLSDEELEEILKLSL